MPICTRALQVTLKNLTVVAVCATIIAPTNAHAERGERSTAEARASCKTERTKLTGERDACKRSVVLRATKGYAFDFDTAKLTGWKRAGTEKKRNVCSIAKGKTVVVDPVLKTKMPIEVIVTARARSKKGHNAGAGFAECVYSIVQVRYVD